MTQPPVTDLTLWLGTGEPFPDATYAVTLAPLLRARGYAVEVVDYMDPAVPLDTPAERPLHVLTGSSTSVNDPSPRMRQVQAQLAGVLERARAGRAAVFGLCFGSQVIAELIGGGGLVRGSPNGLQIGLGEIAPSAAGGALVAGPAVTSHFHFEEVDPAFLDRPDVTHLLQDPHSPVQGYRIGDRIYGYQFHADFDPDQMTRLIRHYAGLARRFELDPEALLADVAARRAAWQDDLLARTLLDPLDRAAAGLGG